MKEDNYDFSRGITPNMIYKWRIMGDVFTLYFDPNEDLYKDLCRYLAKEYSVYSIYGICKNPLEFPQINRGDLLTSVSIWPDANEKFSYIIPRPISMVGGFISVNKKWYQAPQKLFKGDELLSIHPTIPNDYYIPLHITSNMVFKWKKIDEEEYKLFFCPNDDLRVTKYSISRYTEFRKNRYYELIGSVKLRHSTTITDINNWFVVYAYRMEYYFSKRKVENSCKYISCPMIDIVNGDGVMKFAFTEGWCDLSEETHILTIYLGEKANIRRIEQGKLDERTLQIQQRIKDQADKERIKQKLIKRQRKRDLEKQVLYEMMDNGELYGNQHRRPSIPRDVVDAVYRRDRGHCVYCGSTENLQLDHIIPFSRGGATTLENLQLLCQKCNLEKSNKIG